MDMSKVIGVALAGPGCVLAAATAIALAMAAFDESPMWPHRSVNLAEAAGARDESELVRLIEEGVDPNARYPVRPGLIAGHTMQLTPLEAAVASDDPAMVTRLLAKGVAMDAALWAYLRCIAPGERVRSVLDAHRPDDAALTCDGVVAPWNEDDLL